MDFPLPMIIDPSIPKGHWLPVDTIPYRNEWDMPKEVKLQGKMAGGVCT